MKKKLVYLILIATVVNCNQTTTVRKAQDSKKSWITFEESNIPEFPDSLGLGGAFIGVIDDMVIIAGGSNFDQPLWEDGLKQYHDSIYALIEENGTYSWHFAGKLPYPLAHGAAVVTEQEMMLLGGENGEQKFSNILQLEWDSIQKEMTITERLPPLPEAISYHSAVIMDNRIYVAGGNVDKDDEEIPLNNFWELEIDIDSEWRKLISWPGKPRFGASLVKQTNGEYDCLFLFSGKSGTDYLTDAYRYDPKKRDKENRWVRLTDMPRAAVLSPTLPVGTSQIFMFSGSDGHDVDRIAEIGDRYHFVSDILSYNTITEVWYKIGEMPIGVVGTQAVNVQGKILIPGGEIRPSVRTAKVFTTSLGSMPTSHVGLLDYVTFTAYLAIIIGFGFYFSAKNETSQDYFLGGQKIPFWAAGLSLMATQVSAVGFMAIPAKSFATNWSYFAGVFTWFIVIPIVIYGFVPFYRRLNVVSVYEYLEKRFNRFIRALIAVLYLLFQLIGRLGAIIYLPAIALSAVTDMSIIHCILAIGVLATVYTVMGGMYAVIWTDVIQSVVLFGGIILCIVYILFGIDGGSSEFVNIALNDHKFSFGEMDINLTIAAFWIIFVGNIFNRLGMLTSDQSMVQRYMTTSDEKETARALWTSVLASIPWAFFVFGLGTALYVFYKVNPELLNPLIETDAIVPFFISQNLPAGISGVVIAGIFAAAMSSVDSSIHSSTTVLMRDFLSGITDSLSEFKKVVIARWITAGLGFIGTMIAVAMTFFDLASVWDLILEIMGLFAGAMTGVFILGIFTTKANGKGTVIGAIASAFIILYAQNFTPLHFFLYSAVGIISCVVIGYLSSFIFKSDKSLRGLTMFTLADKDNRKTIN